MHRRVSEALQGKSTSGFTISNQVVLASRCRPPPIEQEATPAPRKPRNKTMSKGSNRKNLGKQIGQVIPTDAP